MTKRKRIVSAAVIALAAAGSVMFLRGSSSGEGKYKVKEFHNEIFGENVYIFSPEDNPNEVQKVLDKLWEQQETNQFGEERYSVLFLPGDYDDSIKVQVGYYMQVSGLGMLPADTKIPALECSATWLGDDSNHNATCNFWRGVENLEIESNTMWAVSQATFMRRVNIEGSLYLHDNQGWASGGFLADSKVDGVVDSGSQQQWLSRNCNWKLWTGENWNMVFSGIGGGGAPTGTWPAFPYTTVENTEEIQEKPFLVYGEEGYGVFVPKERKNSTGISWQEKNTGEIIPLEEFYVADPQKDTAETMNQQLKEGKHLLLTPGIYHLEEPLQIAQKNTVVLGMGLATLEADRGNTCMEVTDTSGIKIAGILFDAGEQESENLLVVGKREQSQKKANSKEVPMALSDLFFRVGGTKEQGAKVKNCVEINSSHVTGDNFWVWRADHGEGVGWEKNTAKNGIIINGNDVTMYALMVEHFQEYQTIWNGENGKTIFYQSEIPYDVPNQNAWMSHQGTVNGFASYKVGDDVESHEAWGVGIYSYHRDARVDLNCVMEVPERENIKVHNICSVMITGNPGISHVINREGAAAKRSGERQEIREYAGKMIK